MFDGKVGSSRQAINKRDTKASTKDLVEKAKKEREQRAILRQRNDAGKKLQTWYRRLLVRRQVFFIRRGEFDKKLHEINGLRTIFKTRGVTFLSPLQVIVKLLQLLSLFFDEKEDQTRVFQLQTLISDNFTSTDKTYNACLVEGESYQQTKFLLMQLAKFSLKLLPKNLQERDSVSATRHIGFLTILINPISQYPLTQDLSDCTFKYACQSLASIHQSTSSISSQEEYLSLRNSLMSPLGTILSKSFQSNPASLVFKIQSMSEVLLTLPDVESNAMMMRILQSLASNEIIRNSSVNILGHFLHAANNTDSRAHRFYCIANFSQLFLGSLSTTYDASMMEAIRVPWIMAIRSLLQDDVTPPAESGPSSSIKSAANDTHTSSYATKTSSKSSNDMFLMKNTASSAAAKSVASSMRQGIPLVLYLCRHTPGFPLLLLDSEDHDMLHSAMDIDAGNENNAEEAASGTVVTDPAARIRSAWQLQEQEIFNEYIVGDSNRKIEIRISMILNEIARRENKAFLSQQTQLVMEPIESILKVLTNRDVTAALFDILYDTSLSLHTRLSVISVYAKVLISYPYKILDSATSTASGTASTSLSTTRDALLTTLAFCRPHAPISLLLWSFLWEHFSTVLPILIMTEKKTVLQDAAFQQMALHCELDVDALYMTLISLIYLFSAIFHQQLSATDDQELFAGTVVTTNTLIEMTRFLKQFFYKIFWIEPTCDLLSSFLHPKEQMISYLSVLQYSCLMSCMRLFHQLCIRHERRPFLHDTDYQWPSLPSYEFELVDPETSDRYYQVDRDNNVLLSASANKEGDFFVKNPNLQMVLTCVPQVIPFTQRVSLFQALVDHDKKEFFSALSGRMNIEEMIAGGQIVRISVRRDHMLEDAMRGLHSIGFRMKGRVQVEFISEQGFQEAGIDGGGLFKEFMDDFAHLISDPSLGLFETTSEHLLTPNPASAYLIGKTSPILMKALDSRNSSTSHSGGSSAMDVDMSPPIPSTFSSSSSSATAGSLEGSSDIATNRSTMKAGILRDRSYLEIFEFAGKMLGKALYEKILYQSELAPGFLNVLLGRTNSLDDLYHLDASLYRSLMNLKRFVFQEHGNVEDLDLHFDMEWVIKDKHLTEELIPQGSHIKVNNGNLLIYMHRLAHYKQNVKIRDHCRAFLKGFRVMIPIEWIRMFNIQELQLLISGDRRRINLEDMQQHVVYGSGYHPSQPYIQSFWQIVGEMSAEDQALLLKFVTSSPRQPLLGFQALTPKFSIQQVSAYSSVPLGSSRIPTDEEPRLPTAATCMNLLKLPLYPSVEIMREKLLYAIRSHSGFELS